jgi:hypothetical protein
MLLIFFGFHVALITILAIIIDIGRSTLSIGKVSHVAISSEVMHVFVFGLGLFEVS